MIEIAEEAKIKLRALPIGIVSQNKDANLVYEELEELCDLLRAINLIPLEPEIAKLHSVNSQYKTGTGKAAEIAQLAQECEADCIVFDEPLTPSQQRNWEHLTKCACIDREEVILDIFSDRAQTKEAVLQVQLAKAKYSLPRLTRAWKHLSRQRGGGATNRGQGEAQLETDRRLLKRRIQQLEEELTIVRKQRSTQRKARLRRPVVQGAIVGYTNVGKSSLLKTLSGSEVMVKDQLFATLDPLARQININGVDMVLTDTVGFVRKLPHSLVEAFKSTLEEAVLADFLLLVLDISSPQLDMEWETTLSVLKELGADSKKIQIVFNKCDAINMDEETILLARLKSLFPEALYISCATNYNIDKLKDRLCQLASINREIIKVQLPPTRHDLVALVHSAGQIFEEEYLENGDIHLVFTIETRHSSKFEPYIIR